MESQNILYLGLRSRTRTVIKGHAVEEHRYRPLSTIRPLNPHFWAVAPLWNVFVLQKLCINMHVSSGQIRNVNNINLELVFIQSKLFF